MSEREVVLVTGASSGIGRSISRLLAQEGFTVVGTSRDPAGVEPIPRVQILPLDVRLDESVRSCVDTVLAQHGRLDVLINNAGYVLAGAIEDISAGEAEAQFARSSSGARSVWMPSRSRPARACR